MVTTVRQLDDGAWLSVDDERALCVGELWPLAGHDVCDCRRVDFLVEAIVDVGVDEGVEGKLAGRCVTCGDGGVTDWLELGRVDPTGSRFRRVAAGDVHSVGSSFDAAE